MFAPIFLQFGPSPDSGSPGWLFSLIGSVCESPLDAMNWSTEMSLRALLFVPGLISVLFVAGCGGGGGPVETLVPVGGKLLVDGEPLDGVVVTFIPEISKNRRGGSGTTDATGAFTVTDLDQNLPGLPSGKYTLAYSRRRLPDGSAGPKPEAGKTADTGIIRVETLPTHLTTPNPNVLSNQVEIPKDGNTKLELKISMKS
jgi:hypothetical protein